MASPTPSRSADPRASTASLQQPSALRSVVSLVILIHLTCVLVVLVANFGRSALLSDLVSVFAPYTQFFNFDPDFTPYYLIHSRDNDDHVIVVDLYPKGEESVASQQLVKTVVLPDSGSRWMGERRRYFALANVLAFHAQNEGVQSAEDAAAELARTIGRRLMDENSVRRSVVKVVQRMSQPFDPATLLPGFPPDKPTDPRYDVLQYEADVWYDDEGQVQVVKRAGIGEVAPRQPTTGS